MNKTAFITALAAFGGMLLLPGCNLSSLRDNFNKDDGKEVLAKAKFDRVFIDSTAEMQVYASMNRSEELKNAEASLRFADPYKELYLLVLKESVADFNVYIKNFRQSDSRFGRYVRASSTSDSSRLAIYGGLTSDASAKRLINGNDSLLAAKTLHGMPFRAYTITGSYKKIPLFYLMGVYKGSRHYYQVVVWTMAARRNLYEGVIKKMIESLQEESPSQ